MNKPFKFKQFTVQQDRCAMKVGTDGVLLGAWASIEHQPQRILDIGAGTGLLALQMAQRSHAETIDALELDNDAYEQCVDNFEASAWADRLFCYHASFGEFLEESMEDQTLLEEPYDLILCNPPFYEAPSEFDHQQKDIPENRKKARFYNSLPFEELLSGVGHLLSETGKFATIIPFKEEQRFVSLARTNSLFPVRVTRVKGKKTTNIKRCLLEFSFKEQQAATDLLVIETDRHQYTADYIGLTKAFYLKM
ncbi:tRNA1(Val) (adenine(37)-N6)-methyltransferase [Croceitalea dokdonensis DOKDO 023]|uniref:tRNA1(Val) (adenine(37)-N6)-methyltransferase n=1 Tax=Croceitalea dokdonensis DOKDO 023 TaxID=1300341 RepID=A0A0P7AWD5_9FLAO|nr:methyltransferase [Croceitalea dokdonensis]KPM32299.1 tRNA1(Val) (adenine(37)-N6)-methyltransferase [Croceitalea dokdonensis DOKDO 023]